MELEKNLFPEEEFCKQENCLHHNYISDMELKLRLNIINEETAQKRIAEERKKHCSECMAIKYLLYLKDRKT